MGSLLEFSLNDAGDLIKDIREAITGEAIKDPIKIAELDLRLQALNNELSKGQMEINKTEAMSSNWFVSSWRPFIGWVSGFALMYTFVLAPFLHSLFYVYEVDFPLPELDMGLLVNLVMAMLGIAGLRTYEKASGIQNNKAE